MKHIQIKGLNKPVSKLIMGSDFFRLDNGQEVSDILGHYLAIGGNTIDTAFIYCGGQSEQALGIWLDEMGNRDDINIFTKGAHHDANGPRVNPEAIRSDLFTSLERLRTDYIDLYALHRDDPATPVGVILEALNEHVEAGRIRAFGGSNWTHERLQEAADYAEQHGLIGFSFSSPNLSLAKANEPFWPGCVSTDEERCAGTKPSSFRCCPGLRRHADFSLDGSRRRTAKTPTSSVFSTATRTGRGCAAPNSWHRKRRQRDPNRARLCAEPAVPGLRAHWPAQRSRNALMP